ncbi:MAG: class I SAM-dependent methyltransferase [Flavobacteriales bacterium]|nr:class I SAM-dependent methyltransferase [Flavobacteriales bacterium]
METTKSLEQVENFWNDNLCGKHFITSRYPTPEFFKEYRDFRYKKTHHLDFLIPWSSAKGNKVLEIGLGVGADGTRWAAHAEEYFGVDLTFEAVTATSEHLKLLGLKGQISQGNAENLDFHDKSFDIVYSHGVLHHTTNTLQAIKEVTRVLKDDGEAIVMLYCKDSFNYWFRIQLFFRLKFLVSLFLSKLGLQIKGVWKEHLDNFKTKGWSYFSWKEWPHHCTDGANCDIANIYSKGELLKLFGAAGLRVNRIKQAHFPIGINPKLERRLSSFLGFHAIVFASKK